MKIAIADNNHRKFTDDLINHWFGKYNEVKYEPGASEWLSQWADVYYVDTWDNNIHYLYKLYHGQQEIPKELKWDNSKKPRIICRVLDWEVWIGWVRDQSIIDWVDNIIFIAPHIQQRVESEVNLNGKGCLIRPGVNSKKFTFDKIKSDGFQLGMVLGDMWWPKNHMNGLDIFYRLWKRDNRWKLHIRGQHEPGQYWPIMYDYFLESRGIKDAVTLYAHTDDMNSWYNKIDILLHPGMKEAFSYAVGEAMMKGIPVVVNDFYGSHDIWPQSVLYKDSSEAVKRIESLYGMGRQYEIRKWVKDNYSNSKMFEQMDKLL